MCYNYNSRSTIRSCPGGWPIEAGVILLTKLQGERFVINSNEILRITRVPDTLVELRDGKTIYVREAPGEIIKRVVEFRRDCYPLPTLTHNH